MRPAKLIRDHQEGLLFLVVGAWNTVFGYAIWAMLQYLLGDRVHYLAIVVFAWPIAVLNAYLGYRLVVFRSQDSIIRELPRFSAVYTITLAMNLVFLPIALVLLPFTIYVTQALFTGVVIVCSYLTNKYYTFSGGRRRDGPRGDAYHPSALPED